MKYHYKFSPQANQLIRESHRCRDTDLIRAVKLLTEAMKLITREKMRNENGRILDKNMDRVEAPSG